jgi:hypothetical protein
VNLERDAFYLRHFRMIPESDSAVNGYTVHFNRSFGIKNNTASNMQSLQITDNKR